MPPVNATTDDVLELYWKSNKLYAHYLRVRNGDFLGHGKTPNPQDVEKARTAWTDAYSELKATGVTAYELQQIIRSSNTPQTVKRQVQKAK